MTQGDEMAEVTEGDRERAVEVLRQYYGNTTAPLDASRLTDYIAAALAEEREKARAPFLAVADEMDTEATELWHAYKSAPPSNPKRANPHTEGMSDAYELAADRIRRAAEVGE